MAPAMPSNTFNPALFGYAPGAQLPPELQQQLMIAQQQMTPQQQHMMLQQLRMQQHPHLVPGMGAPTPVHPAPPASADTPSTTGIAASILPAGMPFRRQLSKFINGMSPNPHIKQRPPGYVPATGGSFTNVGGLSRPPSIAPANGTSAGGGQGSGKESGNKKGGMSVKALNTMLNGGMNLVGAE